MFYITFIELNEKIRKIKALIKIELTQRFLSLEFFLIFNDILIQIIK